METAIKPPRSRARRPRTVKNEPFSGGYYLEPESDLSSEELKGALKLGLEDEIVMLRVVIRRVFAAANRAEVDLASWSKTLGILGIASTRLARLLQTHSELCGSESGMNPALAQALAEVVEEMGLQ